MVIKQADDVNDLKFLGPISEAAGILTGLAVITAKKVCETVTSAANVQPSKPSVESSRVVATKKRKASGSSTSKVVKKQSTPAKVRLKKKATPVAKVRLKKKAASKKQTKRRTAAPKKATQKKRYSQ